MWFKNLLVYRFTSPFEISEEDLSAALSEHAFKPCGRNDQSQFGWVAPLGERSDMLFHAANGCLMLCARKEEKILPASVIREKLDARVKQIEAAEDRRIYRKEKETLKEEIIFDCLPQAFTKSQTQYGYLDPKNGWLCLDSSSYAKAEHWIKMLRDGLGSLPVALLQTQESPAVVMTGWLQNAELPEGLTLGAECELKEPGEGGAVAKLKNHDLVSHETEAHLSSGKHAVRLGVLWDEQLQFTLQDDLAIKKLKFSETLISESQSSSDGDKAAQFDADFAIMSSALQKMLPALLGFFGGLRNESGV